MRVSRSTAGRGSALLLVLFALLNLGTVDALVVCRSADGHVRIEWLGDPCCPPTHEDTHDGDDGGDAAGVPELDACGAQCQDAPLAHSFSGCRTHGIQLESPGTATAPAGAGVTATEPGCTLRPLSPGGLNSIPPGLGAATLLL